MADIIRVVGRHCTPEAIWAESREGPNNNSTDFLWRGSNTFMVSDLLR